MALLILKILGTFVLVVANLVWLFLGFGAEAMKPIPNWSHLTTILMLVPTAINGLVLWSMWG